MIKVKADAVSLQTKTSQVSTHVYNAMIDYQVSAKHSIFISLWVLQSSGDTFFPQYV